MQELFQMYPDPEELNQCVTWVQLVEKDMEVDEVRRRTLERNQFSELFVPKGFTFRISENNHFWQF